MKRKKAWLGVLGVAGLSASFLLGSWVSKIDTDILTMGEYELTKEGFYERLRDEPYSETQTFGDAMMEKIVIGTALEMRYGKAVSDEMLEEEITRIAGYYDSEEAFEKNLAENNTTRDAFKSELRFSGLVNQALYEFHPIPEETAKELYEQMFPVGVRIGHILVDDEATAKEVIAKLDAGEAFSDLAKAYSLDEKTKMEGGEYSLLGGYFVPEVEAAALSLERDAYTQTPVKAPYGYHIIKKYADGVKLSYEEEKEGLIANHYQYLMEQDPFLLDKVMNHVLIAYTDEEKIEDEAVKNVIARTISELEAEEKKRKEWDKEYEALQELEVIEEEHFPVEGQSDTGYAFMDRLKENTN